MIFSLLIIIFLVGINFQIDLFGLFHSAKGKSISIYSDERSAKYLLAHRYVPENFDAYILGPSLSANLNPKELKGERIYNLSMMGANITEQKAVVQKAFERSTPKFVILCLHPYLTADHGMKTDMINPKQYYGALGSVSLYKAYALTIIRHFNLMPHKYPESQFNDYGYNHYDDILTTMPVREKIDEQLRLPNSIKTSIDSVALIEFKTLVDDCIARNVKIIAYFHPLPFELYDKYRAPLILYQSRMTEVLRNKAQILDFNTPEYEFFTKDLANYIDHGHLSEKGQAFLLPEIVNKTGALK